MYQGISFGNYTPTLGDLEKAGMPIFNDWWTTFIPEHKAELEKKILHTYHFNQIGAETPDRFIYYLNSQLEKIMPYYNQLYESELIKINPLLNHSIKHEGRTIQNLLTKANTSDDKFSKAIRDFAGITDKTGQGNTDSTSSTIGTKDGNSKTSYSKEGKEHTDDVNDTIIDTTETITESQTKDVTTQEKTKDDTIEDKTRNLGRDTTETPGQITTKVMDWGQTENGTKKIIGNTVADGNGTKEWTETRDDDATTDTVTNLKETTSGSGEKDYADTPQKKLNVGADGTSQLRKDYLTNVTWTQDSSTHNADTTQNQTYKDDETKTHKETTTDKKTTDNTEDTNTTSTKGGSDTETTTLSGKNITHVDENETAKNNINRTIDKNGTENTVLSDTVERNTNTTEKDDRDIDKSWKESGESSTTTHEDTSSINTGNIKNNSMQNEQTHEVADISQSSISNQEKKSEETTDKGDTAITTGFMNVSASQLLEAFRKTFLNIDSMIIEDLRENFMMVY